MSMNASQFDGNESSGILRFLLSCLVAQNFGSSINKCVCRKAHQ
jgi:hypothetical protein